MNDTIYVIDVASLQIKLSQLRSEFDQTISNGESFDEAKKIWLQIKKLNNDIQTLTWQGNIARD